MDAINKLDALEQDLEKEAKGFYLSLSGKEKFFIKTALNHESFALNPKMLAKLGAEDYVLEDFAFLVD